MTALAAAGPRPARRAALLFGLALALSAAPAAADYRESYRKGIVEADRQAWGAAATYMRQAAAEQGKEGETVKIYGVRYVHYLPHFFLGLALAESGSCQEALEQWKESEGQGAVQATPQYKVLLHRRHLCRLQIAGKSPSSPPDRATAAERPAGDEDAARKAAAQNEAARSEAARNEAARREAATREVAAKEAARNEAARKDAAAREAASNEAARKEAARNEAARVESARAEAARNDAARQDAAAREAASRQAASAPAAAQPGPPPELRAAARALFRADYEQVVRTLGGASFGERRAKVTAALLLGAARYALYVQRGARDDRLRRQALDDARTCRRLSPALRPDPSFFSPGFREFYRTAG